VDRSTALDRVRSLAHTGVGVGKVVAGQLGRAAVGVSKAAVAVGHDVVDRAERRRSTRRPAEQAPAPSRATPPPATSTPEPVDTVPTPDESAAVTSDVDAEVHADVHDPEPSPVDVARVVSKKPRSTRPAPAPTRRKPTKKSVPGAKLPPRRPE
jgi:hypothetical protein